MLTCDTCRQQYEAPAYYTFPGEGSEHEDTPGERCTGSFCPDCAGPYLEPDDPSDPRRPQS